MYARVFLALRCIVFKMEDPVNNYLFAKSVHLLQWLASKAGVSYETINVWIFCYAWPLLTIVLLLIVVQQRRHINRLEVRYREIIHGS
jgi:hypothetical protein